MAILGYFYQFNPIAASNVLIVASNTIWMALLKITIKDYFPTAWPAAYFPGASVPENLIIARIVVQLLPFIHPNMVTIIRNCHD
jgi:hypothetical protein